MSENTPTDSTIEATKLEYLAQHPLFNRLLAGALPPHITPGTDEATLAIRQALKEKESLPELKALDRVVQEYRFERGAILAHQGEYADQFYILREGKLETQVEQQVPTVDGLGKTRVFVREVIHLPGACFDDTWIFRPQLYASFVRAREDGRVLLFSRDKFLGYLKDHPKALRAIFPELSPESQELVRHSRFQEHLGDEPTLSDNLRALVTRRQSQEEEDEVAQSVDRRLARLHAKFKLQTEEGIRFQARRSAWILVPRLILPGLLLLILPILTYATTIGIGLANVGAWLLLAVSILVPLSIVGLLYLDWANDWFLITDQQIIQYEFELFRFRTRLQKIPVDKVQSTEVETPNLFARIFKLGTARITTAAQSEVVFFDFITNPKAVEQTINRIREQSQSLSKAKVLREMRHSAENYFHLPHVYQEIRYPSPPKIVAKPIVWMSKRWKSFKKLLESYSHRSESGGVVTYHKHRITLLGAIAPPLGILVALVISWYVFSFFVIVPIQQNIQTIILGLLLLADLAFLVWQIEDWHNDTYQITDRYVIDIDRAPFGFRESRKQAELSRIENVRTEQDGLIPNLFNYGRVFVETAGATSSIVFEQVADPNGVQSDLFKRRDALTRKLAAQENEQRRQEFAIFLDQFDKTARLKGVPAHRPLLKENEEGLAPD